MKSHYRNEREWMADYHAMMAARETSDVSEKVRPPALQHSKTMPIRRTPGTLTHTPPMPITRRSP